QRVFAALERDGFDPLCVELWDDAKSRAKRRKKAASKTCYTCPACGLNAWAKPGVRLMCAECTVLLAPPREEPEDEPEATGKDIQEPSLTGMKEVPAVPAP